MKIISLTNETKAQVLETAKRVLARGGLVVFPSDTVYGLAADATSESAVKKLLSFKDRPQGKAISIAVPALLEFEKYVELTASNKALLETLLPGPFTVVLPSKHAVVKSLEAEDGTLGVRLPDNPFVHELSKTVPFAITATSANITGKGPHYSIDAFLKTLSDKKKELIDLIIDAGQLPHNAPSTVMNLSSGSIEVLRKGELNPVFISETDTYNEEETKLFAQSLLLKYQQNLKTQPLVFILKGDLGSGKTIFAKGIGNALHIENVVSPTFVIYYEYDAVHEVVKKLHHFDLYRTEHKEDLEILGIADMLKPENVLVFEWGERISPIYELLQKHNALVLFIHLSEKNEHTRALQVFKLS